MGSASKTSTGLAYDWVHSGEQVKTKNALRAATDQARNLGIFGAPSMVVGDELFWGDDRLEDAVLFARDKRCL